MRKFTTSVSVALLLLVLAGCIRFQADLTISANDTVSGSVVVAVVVNDDAEDGEAVAAERAQQLEQSLVPALSGTVGVTRTAYTDDGYVGSRFDLRDAPLSAFADSGNAENLTIVRSGDRVVVSGVIDFTDEGSEAPAEAIDLDAEAESSGDISVSVTFPGEILSHDGAQSGRTVTWTTEFDRPITINAESQVDESPDLTLLWVGMIIALLLAIVVLLVVLRLRRRSRSHSAGEADRHE